MNIETKVKVEEGNANLIVERCNMLGYKVVSVQQKADPVYFQNEMISDTISNVTVERDKDLVGYNRICEIEKNIETLKKSKTSLELDVKLKADSGWVAGLFAVLAIIGFANVITSLIDLFSEFSSFNTYVVLVSLTITALFAWLCWKTIRTIRYYKFKENLLNEINMKIEEYYKKSDVIVKSNKK